ncbi:MAG: hypothetical protein P857_115 [Candidatus Xenolissoclinum pacificiensis L6]|uniref:Uncharacterized protein n=1 Tax=Candidatus Xenolissoclinum pacificiensis L6 TaxID=1401685 RepID=W2UYT8_9RICK|nr:MAG: hypothetical protein P857_115 [Candidatus Xenolissoclinum pacificiensis L6]
MFPIKYSIFSSLIFYRIVLTCILLFGIIDNAYAKSFVSYIETTCKQYYSKMSKEDCEELLSIYHNYSLYNKDEKKIAKNRADTLLASQMPLSKRSKKMQKHLHNLNLVKMNLPSETQTILEKIYSEFIKLPNEVQKELIEYSLNPSDDKLQSQQSHNYLENVNKFLTTGLKDTILEDFE